MYKMAIANIFMLVLLVLCANAWYDETLENKTMENIVLKDKIETQGEYIKTLIQSCKIK